MSKEEVTSRYLYADNIQMNCIFQNKGLSIVSQQLMFLMFLLNNNSSVYC